MREIHYYSNYENSYDIDCFFRIGNTPFHFASNGNPIPSFIARSNNIAIQDAVSEIIENSNDEVQIWTDTIRDLILRELEALGGMANDRVDKRDLDEMIEDYSSSFIDMARLGFVSMDLDDEGVFHIIARPIEQNIPDEIMEMLPIVEVPNNVIIDGERPSFIMDGYFVEAHGRSVSR